MTGMVRGRLAAFFGPSIVSVRGLLWFFPIGVLLIVVTVPKDGRVGLTDTRWWIAAVAAQGALIVYVAIIGYYAWYMNRLDGEYGVSEGDDE